MARRDPRARPAGSRRAGVRLTGTDALLAVLLLAGVGVASLSLLAVLEGFGWWFTMMLVSFVVLACGAAARFVARHQAWGSLFAVAGAILLITLLFAPGEAFLGVIPTIESIAALAELQQDGLQSIASQSVPARADDGILFLVAVGAAGLTVALDFAAFSVRMPALTGIPLLVLALVPTFVVTDLGDPMVLVLTAVIYLAILLVSAPRVPRRTALGVGAAAVVAALIVPIFLPSVIPDRTPTGPGDRVATGLNPIITLGNDLRRADPSLALTYTTDSTTGLYLRLTALDDFTGVAWAPDETAELSGDGVVEIGPIPGLTPEVPVTTVTSEVTIANVLSRWLPVPYAPASVDGVVGDWGFDPDLLAVRSRDANARGQEYTVSSVQVAPSVDQLLAAGTTVDAGLERYLALPDDLPAIVAETAAEVVGTAPTNYEKALALQDYFRSGDFTYSEEAPVENDYDGSGASVLQAFLDAKAGYCVHFSSAMAAMARSLDIPSRIAVGFTPGEPTIGADGVVTEYRVSTDNFHAWPELWFAGIGWVRFEPTPSRGETPAFAPSTVDDPATPEVDESVPPPPTSAPTPAPTSSSTAAPSLPPEETDTPTAQSGDAAATAVPWGTIAGVLAALLLLTPALLRLARRRARLMAVEDGSAAQAWTELRDTALDLGLSPADTLTPRQATAELAHLLDDDGAAALARLRDALEQESFAGRPGEPVLADLRTVLWSLRRSAGLWRIVLAAVAPRSLLAGVTARA